MLGLERKPQIAHFIEDDTERPNITELEEKYLLYE